MNGKLMLYVDQYGNKWYAKTVRELKQKIGGKVSKMYRDKVDNTIVHVGYVVGKHWCDMYAPVEIPA